jgi:hypothetical protein
MSVLSIQSIAAVLSAGLLTFSAIAETNVNTKQKFYADDPIWTSPRPLPVTGVSVRKLSEYYDFFNNTFFPSGERAPHKGVFLPSEAINTVDEVADSAWYTNRHATRPMSLSELKAGSGDSHPPAPGIWTVVAAKNEGITPGFRIRDTAGRQYLLKFDPLTNPEMASAADVIVSKFFYALGYNVPENYVVYFDRDKLAIGKDAHRMQRRVAVTFIFRHEKFGDLGAAFARGGARRKNALLPLWGDGGFRPGRNARPRQHQFRRRSSRLTPFATTRLLGGYRSSG